MYILWTYKNPLCYICKEKNSLLNDENSMANKRGWIDKQYNSLHLKNIIENIDFIANS